LFDVVADFEFVRLLDDLSSEDERLAGVNGLSLGMMRRNAMPVSDGFVITAKAFEVFARHGELGASVGWFAERAKAADPRERATFAAMIDVIIRSTRIPDEVREAVLANYWDLRKRSGCASVLARASFLPEVSSNPAFMEKRAAYFELMSEEELLAAVKRCWASVYNPLAIRVWSQRLVGVNLVPTAVVVQAQELAGSNLFAYGARELAVRASFSR
jgi:rifampicin phosphotransferase